MYAISSLLLVIALSLLVGRVATAVLVATGLDARVARFQARSALTGTGFTTSESEQIVNHPQRRKIVMTLMLIGNAGLVASASTLILGFKGGGTGTSWERILELVLGLLVLVYLSRSKWFDRRLTRLIAHVLRSYTDLPERDLSGLLQLSGDYEVSELAVDPGDWVDGRRLRDLDLRDEGVAVLGITRSDGAFRGAPIGATLVRAGDTLLLYGRHEALADLDRRPAGAEGDRRHAEAARRRLEQVREERQADESQEQVA